MYRMPHYFGSQVPNAIHLLIASLNVSNNNNIIEMMICWVITPCKIQLSQRIRKVWYFHLIYPPKLSPEIVTFETAFSFGMSE